jgi:ATP dependent DNA ligase domain
MKAPKPPSGALWLHEIKHNGFRVIARKDGARVKLYSRPGNDLTDRFYLIVEAVARLRSRSCIIDGEAVACDERGIAAFDRIRYRRNDGCVFLYAFDLIELNGDEGANRSWFARRRSRRFWPRPQSASGSTSIWNSTTARPCSTTPAGWGWKASCPSGRTRPIARVARRIGSR